MKKYIWLLLICFSLMLVGCQEKTPVIDDNPVEVTYKYTYDLTLENYTKYIVFRHHHLDQVQGDKQIEVFFETKYPNGIMVDIEATVFLQTEMIFFDSTFHEDEFPIRFTELAQSREVLTYSALKQFRLIAVTEISGKVKTNDETVALADQANMQAKQGLDMMVAKFNQSYDTFSTETYIHVKEGGETTTSVIKTTSRKDPYYSESISSDLSGSLIQENEDGDFEVFALSQYQVNKYYQKVLVIPKEDMEPEEDGLFELSDAWTYRVENGDYVVSGSSVDLFRLIFDDETTLSQWLMIVGNQAVEITFSDLETRLLISIQFYIGFNPVTIETYYSFNTFNPINLSNYIELPPSDKNLADTPIDLSITRKGYIEPYMTYYYQFEVLEAGVYDVTYTSPAFYGIEDELGNHVNTVSVYYLDRYQLEPGIYYLKVFSDRTYIINYQIRVNQVLQ